MKNMKKGRVIGIAMMLLTLVWAAFAVVLTDLGLEAGSPEAWLTVLPLAGLWFGGGALVAFADVSN